MNQILTKICTECGEEKRLECFGNAKQHKDGLSGKCKTCMAAYNKLYREANPEKFIASQKKWRESNAEKMAASQKKYREAHPKKSATSHKRWAETNREKRNIINQRRKAMKKSLISDFTIEQWEACLLYFNYTDAYTGLSMDNPSQDHVIPLSKGGCYTADNIVPCNRNINSSKKNRNMLSWFKKQEFYDSERENRILNYLTYIGKE